MSLSKFITRNPQRINRSMEFPEDAMTPPMGKSPIDAMQDHLNFNSFLANERNAGNISGEDYNILGGYDVSQKMSPGNPIGGMALNLGGGTVYNTLQGLFDTEGQPRELVATPNEDGTISYTSFPTSSQKFSNIPGTVARNTLGASGLISNDLKQTYEDLRAKFENRKPQNITNFNLVDAAGNLKDRIGNLFFTPANAPEPTEKERKSIELEDDLMNYDEFYDMPEEKEKEGIFAALKDKIDPSALLNFMANLYTGGTKQALTGAGIGKAFGNIRDAIGTRLGPASYGTSQAAFNALTPSQQRSVGSIYGPGGIMQGYNAVSAFGRGPIGSIQNRIADILGRKAAQTAASRQKLADLKNALTDLGGDSDAGYSPGQDAGMGFGGGRSDPTDKS